MDRASGEDTAVRPVAVNTASVSDGYCLETRIVYLTEQWVTVRDHSAILCARIIFPGSVSAVQ